MTYRLKAQESIADGVRRVARQETEKAQAVAVAGEYETAEKRVHKARTHCKKLRGLLRLIRPGLGEHYRAENAFLRDAARQLAGARDATVIRRAFDELTRTDRSLRDDFDAVRPALWEQLDEMQGPGGEQSRLTEFGVSMQALRERIDDWPIDRDRFGTLRSGLENIYGRGRSALQIVLEDGSAEDWHEWRKHVKYHWYHIRLLRNVWKSAMDARAGELRRLSELVGDDHDLVVLRGALGGLPRVDQSHIEALIALADRRSATLRAAAGPLGQRIFAEKPRAFGRRMRASWNAWRSETAATTQPHD